MVVNVSFLVAHLRTHAQPVSLASIRNFSGIPFSPRHFSHGTSAIAIAAAAVDFVRLDELPMHPVCLVTFTSWTHISVVVTDGA
jgi:hypothetical protein